LGSGVAKKLSADFFLKSGILGLLVGKGKKEDQFMRCNFFIGDVF
tara:strand:- start:260 stop:394 length:135 start_codon:yes stop_codon:yes gene_type:complete